jgi:hypothetical protein
MEKTHSTVIARVITDIANETASKLAKSQERGRTSPGTEDEAAALKIKMSEINREERARAIEYIMTYELSQMSMPTHEDSTRVSEKEIVQASTTNVTTRKWVEQAWHSHIIADLQRLCQGRTAQKLAITAQEANLLKAHMAATTQHAPVMTAVDLAETRKNGENIQKILEIVQRLDMPARKEQNEKKRMQEEKEAKEAADREEAEKRAKEAEEEKTLPPAFASELRPNLFDELWPNPIEPEVTDALL